MSHPNNLMSHPNNLSFLNFVTHVKVLKPSLKFHLVIFTQSRTEWRPMTGPPPDPV